MCSTFNIHYGFLNRNISRFNLHLVSLKLIKNEAEYLFYILYSLKSCIRATFPSYCFDVTSQHVWQTVCKLFFASSGSVFHWYSFCRDAPCGNQTEQESTESWGHDGGKHYNQLKKEPAVRLTGSFHNIDDRTNSSKKPFVASSGPFFFDSHSAGVHRGNHAGQGTPLSGPQRERLRQGVLLKNNILTTNILRSPPPTNIIKMLKTDEGVLVRHRIVRFQLTTVRNLFRIVRFLFHCYSFCPDLPHGNRTEKETTESEGRNEGAWKKEPAAKGSLVPFTTLVIGPTAIRNLWARRLVLSLSILVLLWCAPVAIMAGRETQ